MEMKIQRVYFIHDYLYDVLGRVPRESLDGKSDFKVKYIITDEYITEAEASDYVLYDSYEEAEAEARA